MLVPAEWPGNVLQYMTSRIISTAIKLRDKTNAPMIPSPISEAHVRFKTGTSRHDVGSSGTMRKSDATDLYLGRNSDAPKVWRIAQAMSEIGGLGIYFDTIYNNEPRILFHIDNRPDRLLWLCPLRDREKEKRTYVYYRDDNPGVFLDLLSEGLSKL